MEQNFEIEFKNELSKEEYLHILAKEFQNSSDHEHYTFQTNYYFDTMDQVLKQQGSVLRMRVTDSFYELTFKVPHQGFLMETNFRLGDNDYSEIIQSKQVVLSSYSFPTNSIPELDNISKDTVFYLFNQFETKRYEKPIDNHLVVLDTTTFQNGVVDYELEVESMNAEDGRLFFESFLAKYSIPKKTSIPKIARAEMNK